MIRATLEKANTLDIKVRICEGVIRKILGGDCTETVMLRDILSIFPDIHGLVVSQKHMYEKQLEEL